VNLQSLHRTVRSLLAVASVGTFLVGVPMAPPALLPDAVPAAAGSCAAPVTPSDPTSGSTSGTTSGPASWPQARVAEQFDRVTPDAADRLADVHPAEVGSLDGAPLAVRYRANARLAGPAYAGRHLLLFDRTGTGRVVEVLGEPSTARRIAVLVPGVDTRLVDFDRGLGGVRRRAPGWQARQLRAMVGPDVAVVAWLGYLPPEGIGLAAARSDSARLGADELMAFVRGLAVQAPQATVVVVGHSYGSLVAGYAARRLPAAVTDVIAIGSPGLDVAHCRDLRARARVWAGSDPSDWTRRLPDIRVFGLGHGRNPSAADFGALPLNVADAHGHDGYFVPGTAALRSIARVVSGG
jgi:pimeloyl-ACP methyl ester carboxylesterase